MGNKYVILNPLVLEGLASPRYAELSTYERNRNGCRILGGDKGDIHFDGYTLDEDALTTTLDNPLLVTSFDDLNDEEAENIATEILGEALDSVGLEAVETT